MEIIKDDLKIIVDLDMMENAQKYRKYFELEHFWIFDAS